MKYAKSKLIKTRMASLAVAQRGRKQAVEDIPVTLLIPMSRLGGGRYALYQRGAGSYFVRTVGPVSQQDLGVSVDAAAKIYEFEVAVGAISSHSREDPSARPRRRRRWVNL